MLDSEDSAPREGTQLYITIHFKMEPSARQIQKLASPWILEDTHIKCLIKYFSLLGQFKFLDEFYIYFEIPIFVMNSTFHEMCSLDALLNPLLSAGFK